MASNHFVLLFMADPLRSACVLRKRRRPGKPGRRVRCSDQKRAPRVRDSIGAVLPWSFNCPHRLRTAHRDPAGTCARRQEPACRRRRPSTQPRAPARPAAGCRRLPWRTACPAPRGRPGTRLPPATTPRRFAASTPKMPLKRAVGCATAKAVRASRHVTDIAEHLQLPQPLRLAGGRGHGRAASWPPPTASCAATDWLLPSGRDQQGLRGHEGPCIPRRVAPIDTRIGVPANAWLRRAGGAGLAVTGGARTHARRRARATERAAHAGPRRCHGPAEASSVLASMPALRGSRRR